VKDARGLDSGNVAAVDVVAKSSADIAVTNADSPDPVGKGGLLTYTVTVRNAGPFGASGVVAKDVLPKKAELKSVKTTQGTCKPAKANETVTVSCALGNLAKDASATITITVKPTVAGTATSSASASATSPEDPNPSNNSATATTTVTG
jgi:uncharacterized repeat protein (TIGR01451 family)